MPAPRRDVRSTPDGGSAVQPPGLSYTAHWEALGCALCLLTTTAIFAHGPGVGLGLLPRLPPPTCSRPVSGVGLGPFCYAASLLRSPGPYSPPVLRSAICDCLSLNVSILTSTPVRIHEDIIISAESLQPRADAMVGDFEIYK